MKIENPKLILEELNSRIDKAMEGMNAYDKEDKEELQEHLRYLHIWNELFELRKALFHQHEIDEGAD